MIKYKLKVELHKKESPNPTIYLVDVSANTLNGAIKKHMNKLGKLSKYAGVRVVHMKADGEK